MLNALVMSGNSSETKTHFVRTNEFFGIDNYKFTVGWEAMVMLYYIKKKKKLDK